MACICHMHIQAVKYCGQGHDRYDKPWETMHEACSNCQPDSHLVGQTDASAHLPGHQQLLVSSPGMIAVTHPGTVKAAA